MGMRPHFLVGGLVGCLSVAPALAAPAVSAPLDGALKGGAFEQTISLSLADMPLQDALRLVAQKGHLNVMLGGNFSERVNLEVKDVRLGDALDTLMTMGGLQAFWRGNVLAVVDRPTALERGLLAGSARVFRLRFASADRVAEYLNAAAIARPYSGKNQSAAALQIAKADTLSNTVLVMGAPSEVALAERLIQALDAPTSRKVYKLSHANAVNVASVLNGSLFNNAPRSANAATNLEQVRVDVESIQDGTGGNSSASGVELSNSPTTIRSRSVQSQSIGIEPRFAMAVPDSRTNSVIVMGSVEVLAHADDLVAQLDRPVRQVSIEVEIIEKNAQDALDLGTTLGGGQGRTSGGFDTTGNATANNLPQFSVTYDSSANVVASFRARLNALIQEKRARVLAHPTVIASDNSESQINIVDEVIKGTRISNQATTSGTQPLVVVEPIYGVAGVTLNILPTIGADGTITLRLHPTVSSVRDTQRDSQNNLLSLLSRRELIAQQVTVPSGSTLSLGGLTQTSTLTTRSKLPILGDIPFVGGIFGSLSTSDVQTELMILVKPQIL